MTSPVVVPTEFHPIANLFPINEKDIAALAESIKAVGLQQPLLVYENKIADGRHRVHACERVGFTLLPEHFVVMEGKPDEVRARIIQLNMHRRSLSSGQRRELIKKLRMENPKLTERDIGRIMGVSHTTVGAALNPKDKKLEDFLSGWARLSEEQKKKFVEANKAVLRAWVIGGV